LPLFVLRPSTPTRNLLWMSTVLAQATSERASEGAEKVCFA
jgi:hypothetical protein